MSEPYEFYLISKIAVLVTFAIQYNLGRFITYLTVFPMYLWLPCWFRWQRICCQAGNPSFNINILDWRIPWIEEPGELESMGLQKVRHDWVTNTLTSFPCTFNIPNEWLHFLKEEELHVTLSVNFGLHTWEAIEIKYQQPSRPPWRVKTRPGKPGTSTSWSQKECNVHYVILIILIDVD